MLTEEIKISLVAIDQDLEKQGWDQPSRLFTVFRTDSDGPVKLLEYYEQRQFQMAAAKADHVADVLDWLAASMRESPIDFASESGFVGFLLVQEAWSLPAFSRSQAEMKRLAEEHRFAEQPDRIELRVLILAALDFMVYMSHQRDTADIEFHVEATCDEPELDGRIPRAMRELVAAFPQ